MCWVFLLHREQDFCNFCCKPSKIKFCIEGVSVGEICNTLLDSNDVKNYVKLRISCVCQRRRSTTVLQTQCHPDLMFNYDQKPYGSHRSIPVRPLEIYHKSRSCPKFCTVHALAPETCDNNCKNIIFKLIKENSSLGTHILLHIRDWCHHATSDYLSQCSHNICCYMASLYQNWLIPLLSYTLVAFFIYFNLHAPS